MCQPICHYKVNEYNYPFFEFRDYDLVDSPLSVSMRTPRLCIWDFPVSFNIVKPQSNVILKELESNLDKILYLHQKRAFQARFQFYKGATEDIEVDQRTAQ